MVQAQSRPAHRLSAQFLPLAPRRRRTFAQHSKTQFAFQVSLKIDEMKGMIGERRQRARTKRIIKYLAQVALR
jgi:hypothetical protein